MFYISARAIVQYCKLNIIWTAADSLYVLYTFYAFEGKQKIQPLWCERVIVTDISKTLDKEKNVTETPWRLVPPIIFPSPRHTPFPSPPNS